MNKTLKFPDGFLWGTATSAHQVEGNNLNDWTEWEKKNAARLAKEAKNHWRKWQQEKFPEMFNPKNYISGRTCDHYNRYEEDFDLAKEMGHNAYRFSIEWSRIEPEEGKFNEKEIEHYRRVIQALRVRGIEPFVTLWHWTIPLWFRNKGGWLCEESPKYFERYVEKIVRAYPDVKFWMTLNEPALYSSLGFIKGTQPPGKRSIFTARKAKTNLIKAHKLVYKTIHSISSVALVGVGNPKNFFIPHKNKLYNKILAKIVSHLENDFFKKIKKDVDYIALHYYRSIEIGFKFGGSFLGMIESNLDSGGERTDLGWKIYPEGMYYFLKDLKKYRKSVYITENGLADIDDKYRAKFIIDHLKFVHKAISEGINVRGYFYWSLIDNFEFVEVRGFWPRFGLVEIDYSAKGGSPPEADGPRAHASGGKTLERKPRPSSRIYSEIAKNNEIPFEMLNERREK